MSALILLLLSLLLRQRPALAAAEMLADGK